MGHVDERDPDLTLERLQFELHLLAELEVEGSERLIEKEDGGAVDQGPGQSDPLLLPAGHLPGPSPLVSVEADQGQGLADSALLLLALHLPLAQAVAHVLGDVHVREQGVVLEDRVDVPLVGRHPGDRLAGQQDLARGRLLEAGDHAQGRGLAAAGRAEERVEGPGCDAQVHRIDRHDVSEPLRDVQDLDIRLGRSRRSGRSPAGGRARLMGVGGRGGGQRRSSRDGCGR